MNLNDISDEELDNLFRKSAESSQLPFDPEAWAAMNKRLDATEMKRSWGKRLILLLLLPVLISIVLIIKFYPFNIIPEENTPSLQGYEVIGQTKKAPLLTKNKNSHQQPEINVGEIKGKGVEKDAVQPQINGFKNNFRFRATYRKERLKQETKPYQRPNSSIPLPQDRTMLPLKEKSGNAVTKAYYTTLGEYPQDSIFLSKYLTSINKPTSAEKTTDSLSNQKITINVIQGDTAMSTGFAKSNGEGGSDFLKSVQVVLAVAPDFTTVKFKDPESISSNGGLLLAIPISKRFHFVTGAILGNKIYSAQPGEYKGAGSYYNGPGELTKIDGTCLVLDIPVNIRYTVLVGQKNSLAVQAGVSSYLMLSEKYTSHYRTSSYYGDYYSTSSWEVYEKNQHWFAVQNFSLVYNRALTKKLGAGVEPFVKVPISGVGAGKVKLTSAGVFFTLGYTIGLKQ